MLQKNQAKVSTPAEKRRWTRAFNKAYAIMDQTVEPEYKEWVAALDDHCTIRDAKLAQLDAERMAAISKIEDEFELRYSTVSEEFKNAMKPTQDAYDKAREEAFVVFNQTMKEGN